MNFVARYVEWALENCDREVDLGLPNIRDVYNMRVLAIRSYSRSLSDQQTKLLLRALMKSRYVGVLQGDLAFSPEDERLVAGFQAYFEKQTFPFFGRGRLSVQRLKSAVRASMEKLPGWVPMQDRGGLVYALETGARSITARFSFGTRSYDLSYEHWVIGPDFNVIAQGISVLGWLGLGQTTWQNLSEPELDLVGRVIERNIPLFARWVATTSF